MIFLDFYTYLVLALGLVFAWLIEETLCPRLLRIFRIRDWQIGQILIRGLRGKFYCLAALLVAYIVVSHFQLKPKTLKVINRSLISLLILLVTAYIASISGKFISNNSTSSSGVIPSATILNNITKVILYLIGILIVINSLGISITPLITALGIGGLAVSLALQETLSNLFSGVQILISKQIRPGHFISMEPGVKGYISDIGWRTTILKDLNNNTVIIPNKSLSAAIIKNYHTPNTELAVRINVGVAYDSDLELVEKVIIAVAKEVMGEVEGGIKDFSPFIRISSFGDFAINITAILRAKEYDYQFHITHEFLKRIAIKFKEENITIPFPTRTIEVTNKSVNNPMLPQMV